jgi:hypothetical protein
VFVPEDIAEGVVGVHHVSAGHLVRPTITDLTDLPEQVSRAIAVSAKGLLPWVAAGSARRESGWQRHIRAAVTLVGAVYMWFSPIRTAR